jgi:hypothetical protein
MKGRPRRPAAMACAGTTDGEAGQYENHPARHYPGKVSGFLIRASLAINEKGISAG